MSRKKKGLQFKDGLNLENTFWANNSQIDTPKQFKDFTEKEKVALYYMNPLEAHKFFSNPEVMKDKKRTVKLPPKPTITNEEQPQQTETTEIQKAAEAGTEDNTK